MNESTNNNSTTILVEIWSDIVCPWCYIGKRRMEQALAEFPRREQVKVEWKSFQLSPDTQTDPSITINDYLVREKGISPAQAEQMSAQVTQVAAGVDLHYQFDRVIPANTFQAHRLLHFAKAQGRQNDLKERLQHAYFVEGANIDDRATLLELGAEVGLDASALAKVLDSEAYTLEVRADLAEARQFGIRGVPYFVFDRKYGVSGAQEAKVLLNVLEKCFAEQ